MKDLKFIGKLVLFLLFMLLTQSGKIQAQPCWPPNVSYIVRDENNRILDPDVLESPQLKNEKVSINVYQTAEQSYKYIYFATGYKTNPEPKKLSKSKLCSIKIDTLILHYKGKTMKLVFNIDIDTLKPGFQRKSSYIIDSLPFRTGVFVLDFKSIYKKNSDHAVLLVPPSKWHRQKLH